MTTRVDSTVDTSAQPTAAHVMQCMEIWGGNRAAHHRVSVTGIDACVMSQPYAGQGAGGDVHYISMCGGGKIARFAVADVSGHGDAVSNVASQLRALVRKHINTVDLTRFVRSLNGEFSRLADSGTFATAILATYFAPTDHLILVNAGHPAPLWYSTAARQWQRLEETQETSVTTLANLPLGVIDPTEYCQFAIPLKQGDQVLMFTDSLTEATSPEGEQLGEDGLLKIVRSLPPGSPEVFCESLLARVADHRGGQPADDDVTVLMLEHNARNPARKSIREWTRVIARMLGLSSV